MKSTEVLKLKCDDDDSYYKELRDMTLDEQITFLKEFTANKQAARTIWPQALDAIANHKLPTDLDMSLVVEVKHKHINNMREHIWITAPDRVQFILMREGDVWALYYHRT